MENIWWNPLFFKIHPRSFENGVSAAMLKTRFVQNFEISFGWMNHFVILSKMAKTDNLGIFVPLGDP